MTRTPNRRRFYSTAYLSNGLRTEIEDEARVFILRPDAGTVEVIYYGDDHQSAYRLWLGLPKRVRAAMRNAGEKLPVYRHDLVTT